MNTHFHLIARIPNAIYYTIHVHNFHSGLMIMKATRVSLPLLYRCLVIVRGIICMISSFSASSFIYLLIYSFIFTFYGWWWETLSPSEWVNIVCVCVCVIHFTEHVDGIVLQFVRNEQEIQIEICVPNNCTSWLLRVLYMVLGVEMHDLLPFIASLTRLGHDFIDWRRCNHRIMRHWLGLREHTIYLSSRRNVVNLVRTCNF